jgi:RNA polymerase sigma-70 factor (ECF subfamily)
MDKGLAELEKRVKDDPEAFSRLYRLNYRRIFNYALYSTGDMEISLDLTSETFFKALRAIDRFDHRRGTFTAWLYAIASREIAMHYRRLGKIKKHIAVRPSFTGKAEEIRRSIPAEEVEDARRELERCEDLAMLAPMFRRLSPRYREVLFLRFFEDRSLDDIAGILGRPVGTVKAQCHRGLKMLRKRMQPLEGMEHMEEQEAETEKEMESSLEGAGESGT